MIKPKKNLKKQILKFLNYIFFLFLFFVLMIGILFVYYSKDLPRPKDFQELKIPQSTKIYDREGRVVLFEVFKEEKREYISLEKIPQHLIWAVLVAEDKDFYKHKGLSLKGMIRAFFTDIKIMKPTFGGSTITQQLIRSTYLTNKKTIERKIKEIILSLELEKKYSKDQILEWYLNQIPFGGNAYGVEAASQTYFQKTASQLALEESAVLASLIKAPSYYSPWKEHKNELLERKNYILERMYKEGYISKEEMENAQKKEIVFSPSPSPLKAPHFALYVRDWLQKKYGQEFLEQEGLKIYTTLDWKLQEIAEEVVKEGAKKNEKYNCYNAGLVAIDPKTGDVLALVGSKDWFANPYPENCLVGQNCLFDPKYNIAFALRQPGSSFKPFVYALAFKKGYTPKTIIWDVKTEFNVNCRPDAEQIKDQNGLLCYHPENYNKKFKGPVSLREALAQSINVASVKLLYLVGVKESIELAKTMGITTLGNPSRYGLSLVLGGGEVTLFDMTSAFGVFAQEGIRYQPRFIFKIEDAKGNIIYETKPLGRRVLEKEVAQQINDVLSDNQARAPAFGAHSPLYFGDYEVAAKTGTSDDFKDTWTIGYSPSLVVGVWAGNNNNKPTKGSGIILAGPIFHNFLEKALKFFPKENFSKPPEKITGKNILDGIVDLQNPHSILYYINKNDPLGPPPQNPQEDPLFWHFEMGIKNWIEANLNNF